MTVKWGTTDATHRAEVLYHAENGLAVISLNREWQEVEPTDAALDRAAFHECGHLLMARYCMFANLRSASEFDLRVEEHAIIRKLEHMLFGERG